MGEALLPDSAIIFCTSLPTKIRYSSQNYLQIESDIDEYNYSERGISSEEIQDILESVCREPENPNNIKKISKIVIGLPQGILDGKEIVDVPGFTKGNPLHQAFAEQYAKHYCDVCLVLINNPESIEIGDKQGLEALAKCFRDRLDSTIFIVNKCDDSSARDIKYIRHLLRSYFRDAESTVIEISARNSLCGNGNQFEFQKLLGDLTYLSTRRVLILVRALLSRLISNVSSLRELCQLTAGDLDTLHENIDTLLKSGVPHYKSKIKKNLEKTENLPKKVPELDIEKFNLPQNPLGESPYNYAKKLIESIIKPYKAK